MRKVSAEEIKDNIIRYGLPEDATDDVKEVAKQMEKEEVNRIYKNVTQCHPRCPSITRFRQIWPTYNDFNSITSAVRTQLFVGLPKPFLD